MNDKHSPEVLKRADTLSDFAEWLLLDFKPGEVRYTLSGKKWMMYEHKTLVGVSLLWCTKRGLILLSLPTRSALLAVDPTATKRIEEKFTPVCGGYAKRTRVFIDMQVN